MIKQALNASTIAEVMRRFVKDDAIKILGKSTYNKWLKKLPTDRIAASIGGWRLPNTSKEVRSAKDILRSAEAYRRQRARDVSDALMDRYGPSFAASLPQVDTRLDTRGRLKGAVLKEMPRVHYLRDFADRNNLVSRNELLRWNRTSKAGLDPKTLTSEWYVKPRVNRGGMDAADFLRKPRLTRDERTLPYNGKEIPVDVDHFKAQLVRNIAAVPYTDPIRYTAAQLVANELRHTLLADVGRRSIYNSVSDNTRKVLDYVNGRNVLEDPRALRLVEAADKHKRLYIPIEEADKNGTNASYSPVYNILAVHPRLTQDSKNHERSHYLLYNMGAQEHADAASRAFRGINAISRKNPEYSDLANKLINRPATAHEAVADYYRHKLFGTLDSRTANLKAQNLLNTETRFSEPEINRIISETQNLTSNPSLQQALQQLAIDYNVPLRNV